MSQVAARAQPSHVALKGFEETLAEYLRLLERLRAEVPSLEVTADAADIHDASRMLAVAIQRARPKARQGDFFDPAAAREITRRVRDVLNATDVGRLVARINDEPAFKSRPQVYMRFPGAWSLATMPTPFLEVLPPLPDALEYRFVGSHLILRDRNAAIVLDYVVRALPSR